MTSAVLSPLRLLDRRLLLRCLTCVDRQWKHPAQVRRQGETSGDHHASKPESLPYRGVVDPSDEPFLDLNNLLIGGDDPGGEPLLLHLNDLVFGGEVRHSLLREQHDGLGRRPVESALLKGLEALHRVETGLRRLFRHVHLRCRGVTRIGLSLGGCKVVSHYRSLVQTPASSLRMLDRRLLLRDDARLDHPCHETADSEHRGEHRTSKPESLPQREDMDPSSGGCKVSPRRRSAAASALAVALALVTVLSALPQTAAAQSRPLGGRGEQADTPDIRDRLGGCPAESLRAAYAELGPLQGAAVEAEVLRLCTERAEQIGRLLTAQAELDAALGGLAESRRGTTEPPAVCVPSDPVTADLPPAPPAPEEPPLPNDTGIRPDPGIEPGAAGGGEDEPPPPWLVMWIARSGDGPWLARLDNGLDGPVTAEQGDTLPDGTAVLEVDDGHVALESPGGGRKTARWSDGGSPSAPGRPDWTVLDAREGNP